MAIHFFPKVGGRVDFDTPEEAARFFEITGGGTIEAPKPEVKAESVVTAAPPVVSSNPESAPKVKAKRKTSSLKQRLEDSIQIVMGDREMSAPEIHKEIIERGWLPDSSKDPLNYIRYTLSSNKAIFKSQSRGRYRLDPSNPYTQGKHQAPIEGHINPKTTKSKEKPVKPLVVAQVETEAEIEEPLKAEIEPIESQIEDPICETQPIESETDDTESLIEQLSQEEPVVEPEVTQPPITEAQKPQVVAAPKPIVAPKPPVKLPVVNPPEIEASSDPVADILSEFANELGNIV